MNIISNKVTIIDCDSLIYSAFHPNKVLDINNQPLRTKDGSKFIYKDKSIQEIIESCDFIMNSILTKTNCTHYIGFVKGNNTTKNKELINPDYKSNRSNIPPKYWNFTKEYLKLKWNITEIDNIESDDACRISNLNIKDSFICAIDSDLLGLSGTHYNWRKDEWITRTKEEEDYKFWCDMITGTHNNTKGIPGKGIEYAKSKLSKENYYEEPINSWCRSVVFHLYINTFGEYKGIKEFYRNYISIKVLENYEEFIIPPLNEVRNNSVW